MNNESSEVKVASIEETGVYGTAADRQDQTCLVIVAVLLKYMHAQPSSDCIERLDGKLQALVAWLSC